MFAASAENAGGIGIDTQRHANAISLQYKITKDALDCCLALVMLVVTAPIILLSMLLVRLTSKGPALYTQQRLGRHGRLFNVFKVRTMYQDSEHESEAVWSLPGDLRVTPLGRFLRASHLDELPQLVNVLRREMSLIGPRPERPEIAAQLERALPDYPLRLSVRPGLTGLAQVLQGPDIDLGSVRRKLDYDLYYLDRLSLWLDLRTLLATVLHLAGLAPSRIARIALFPAPKAIPIDGPIRQVNRFAPVRSLYGDFSSPLRSPAITPAREAEPRSETQSFDQTVSWPSDIRCITKSPAKCPIVIGLTPSARATEPARVPLVCEEIMKIGLAVRSISLL
jgi:lipopolysaccharide/colanic/teichoic acid biosynthesis glycosyltransferase